MRMERRAGCQSCWVTWPQTRLVPWEMRRSAHWIFQPRPGSIGHALSGFSFSSYSGCTLEHVQWTRAWAGRSSAQTCAFLMARGGSRAMWPNGFDNPHAFLCASWVESFIEIAKSLPLGRLLHGSRPLQWPCQGILSCPEQFQGTRKRQGGPGPSQACGPGASTAW
jgi:hypothetical protein